MLYSGLQATEVYKNDIFSLICSRTSSSYVLKCKHVTLAISVLKNIYPLHTKMLKYPNVPL